MSTVTSLINTNFGGIRRKDSVFSDEKITCSDCQNVELFFTKLNSGVGIRTANGNISLDINFPSDEEIVGMYESNQDGEKVVFIHSVSNTSGKIYYLNLISLTLTTLIENMSISKKSCGTDFTQGWLDMFVFSNGDKLYYIYSNTEAHDGLHVELESRLHLIDADGRTVNGLGIVNYDKRIWVFNNNTLWYSQQGECRNFTPSGSDLITDAGYIEMVKPITAIYPYLGSLAVFHKDSSALVQTNSTTRFIVTDESPGGCASYSSLVFHGTDLYFYDDTKKGVYSFQQIINGDKTLGQNIALDIQDELLEIKKEDLNKIKALSVVTKDRNEVWFIIPTSKEENRSIIMIFDYIRGEWVKRKSQKINTASILNNELYSGGKKIYKEYIGENFDGEFIEHFYQCTILNFGTDNTLKITKFPPRATLDSYYTNNFFVKYVKNYNRVKAPKIKEIKTKAIGNVLKYDSGMNYDSNYMYKPNSMNCIVRLPSATFKALEITFYTEEHGQNFCFKTLEFSKIKIKQV